MRWQLILAATAMVAPAHADGTLSMRGVYYKERATRVMQPMLDGMFEVGTRGLVAGHFLVDAITSASASSGAADAVAFTENRYEAGLGYTHELDGDLRVSGQAKYSTESDYISMFAGVRGELDLAQKNTTLGLGVGISNDQISAGSAQGPAMPTLECSPGDSRAECALSSYALFASASQILDRNTVLGLTYDVAKLDGYQSNPYRTALANDGIAPERHPTERVRQAFAASVRRYVPRSETTFIAAYRYYLDSWELHAHTPELRIIQQVGRTADASVRYRFHTQDAAFFYRDRYPSTDISMVRYLSDDVKLDEFTGHTFEGKLGVLGETFDMDGRWAGARFEGILQYALQHPRFGNAIIAHVALTVPFDY
jgi:hypothetical protein